MRNIRKRKSNPLPPPFDADKKRKNLDKKNLQQLGVVCRKYKLPYINLNRKEVLQNIDAWINKEVIPYKGKVRTAKEIYDNPNRKITPRMRRFAFEYSFDMKSRKNSYWAKQYEVKEQTIWSWLKVTEIIKLIDTFQSSRESIVDEKFQEYASDAIDCLILLMKEAKSEDTRRKCIQDFFGYMGRQNVNNGPRTILNNQMMQQNNTQNVNKTDKQLQEELDQENNELQDLLD